MGRGSSALPHPTHPLLRLTARGSPEESAHVFCQSWVLKTAPEDIYFVLLLEGADTGVGTCQRPQEASEMLERYSS